MADAMTQAHAKLTAHPGADTTRPAAQPGEPPQERWPTILENARKEAAAQSLKQALGNLTAEQARELAPWYQRAQADPEGFHINGVLEHPDPMAMLDKLVTAIRQKHGPETIASYAARKLAESRGTQEPEFLIPQADGSIGFDKDAFGRWKQWQAQQVAGELRKEIAPLKADADARKAETQRVATEAKLDHWYRSTLSEAQSWEGMRTADGKPSELSQAVGAELQRDPVWNDPNATLQDNQMALYRAYIKVASPRQRQQGSAALLTSLKQKAVAQTESPSSAAASPGARPKNPAELARYMEKVAAGRR